ncbi:MAG: septum formation initiator family protein [Paludibacteraceae bacterium]|nr:septum formation initiator family protein [Paludibacteraceae bacterium]
MEEKTMWQKVRKVLINKYAIAIYVFLLMLLFMGDNSLVHYMKRARKIRMVKEQIVDTQQEIREAQSVIQMLDNTDSLEHFAREEYRMHAPNEDVYIVEP